MRLTVTVVVAAVVVTGSLPAAAQVVGHEAIDGVASLPQDVMDAVGQQLWFFSHASVGGNMVAGLGDLHSSDPIRYQLATSPVSYLSGELRAADPPTPTQPGTVYECNRSNPGWSAKLAIFDSSVRVSGWRRDAVGVAMDKLCYIDQNADAAAYLATMTALETSFPSTVFVYITMPLTESADAANVLRNEYNTAVRAHCESSGSLLFDLADMEAHEVDGTPCSFAYGQGTYQRLCDGYSDDGGHLNGVGRQRIAAGWYATAAAIVDAPIFADSFESGTTERWSATSS